MLSRSPGSRISAKISRAIDEPRRCARIGIGFGSQSHAIRHPRLWIIRYIAQEFHLHLVGRVEPTRRAIVFPHGAKGICADTVKVEVIACVFCRAVSGSSAAVSAARSVVPVVLVHPAVPAFMVEIAGSGARVSVGREIWVIKQTRGLHFIRAEEVSGESAEYAGVVGGRVVEVI